MKMKLLLIAIVAMTSACAPKVWIRDGVSEDQRRKDHYDCKIMANTAGPGNPLIQASEFKNCMRSKGYELETEDY